MSIAADDPRIGMCGFAKCWGDTLGDYYVRKYHVTIGRPNKAFEPDIPLADNKLISRRHAAIQYNFQARYLLTPCAIGSERAQSMNGCSMLEVDINPSLHLCLEYVCLHAQGRSLPPPVCGLVVCADLHHL